MRAEDVYARTTANRLAIADVLAGLDDEQWQRPTLCAGWSVHVLAGHLLQPMLVGFGRFLVTALRYRGDTDRTVDHHARRLARRTPAELVTLLRAHASDRVDPPRVGPFGPFVDTCVHLRDIARPLGLAADVPAGDWQAVLDHLVSPGVAPALVPAGRLDGLALVATDSSWRAGSGARLEGPMEALALVATGRPAALADLDGDGVGLLAARLGGAPDRS